MEVFLVRKVFSYDFPIKKLQKKTLLFFKDEIVVKITLCNSWHLAPISQSISESIKSPIKGDLQNSLSQKLAICKSSKSLESKINSLHINFKINFIKRFQSQKP